MFRKCLNKSILCCLKCCIFCCCEETESKNYKEITDQDRDNAIKSANIFDINPNNDLYFDRSKYEPIIEIENGWLQLVSENSQSYSDYLKFEKRNRDGIIYIAILDDLNIDVDKLKYFVEIWFQKQVVILYDIRFIDNILCYKNTKTVIKARHNDNIKSQQFLVKKINNELEKIKNDLDNSLCLIALTSNDLYPDDNWNYVFGESYMNIGIGTFSTYHFNIDNLLKADQSFKNVQIYKDNFFRMICHIAVHEIGHMFGIEHCVYYACNMNGCMSIFELVQQPTYLCPIDLRKLQYVMNLDVAKRHELLKKFYEENDFIREVIYSKSFDNV